MKNEPKSPLVSVIIPCFNIESYIHKCLSSLILQTYQNIEVIIIDDGSTDGTGEIINTFCNSDPRFFSVRKVNEGQGAARNTGLRASSGRFILFIDGDDFITSETIENLVNLCLKSQCDVVCFRLQFNSPSGALISKLKRYTKLEMTGNKIFEMAMLDREFLTSAVIKIYSREFLIKNDIYFPDVASFEDTLFSRKVAFHAEKVCFTNEIYYNATVREGSTSRSLSIARFQEAIDLLKREESFLQEKSQYYKFEDLFRVHCAKFLSYLLLQAIYSIASDKIFSHCVKISKPFLNLSLWQIAAGFYWLGPKFIFRIIFLLNPVVFRRFLLKFSSTKIIKV